MMEIIENILPQQFSSSLGWMLFHSIWQGILISCLVMLLLKLVPRDDPNVKHNVIALGLGVLLFSSVITFVHIYFSHGVQSGPAAIYLTGLSQSFSQAITDKTSGISIGYWINRNVHLISILWIFGVVLASFRIIGGITYIKIALRKSGSIFPKTWITTLSRLKTNLQIDKRVALGTTDLISSPVMTGFLRPMILFPVAVVNHLSPGEAEAIIAHELAHIKRNDYLLNLLYCLIEVIYFFNPAAWWMLQKVRAERENSCDDLAISLGIDRLQYARALIKIQELKTHYQIALSFGGRSSSLLMTRIQRVLNGRFSSGRQHQSLLYIFLLLFSAMFVMSVRFPIRN